MKQLTIVSKNITSSLMNGLITILLIYLRLLILTRILQAWNNLSLVILQDNAIPKAVRQLPTTIWQFLPRCSFSILVNSLILIRNGKEYGYFLIRAVRPQFK